MAVGGSCGRCERVVDGDRLPVGLYQAGEVSHALGERRHGVDVGAGRVGEDILEVDHEERLVAAVVEFRQYDGPVDLKAGLGPGERSAGDSGRVILEQIGVKDGVTFVIVQRAVEFIGAAFERNIDGAAAGAPVFGVISAGLNFEFGGGVLAHGDGEVGGTGVLHADVGDSVEQEVVGEPLTAVDVEVFHAVVVPGTFGIGGFRIGPGNAGGEQGQHDGVAAQDGCVDHGLAVDDLAARRVFRLQAGPPER